MNLLFARKVAGIARRKADALLGRMWPLEPTLGAMALRPYELHIELTNLCNANCIFCPYQFQERAAEVMSDEVFKKAVNDYIAEGGGSVQLTPIVGDALIDPKFLDRVRYLRAQPSIDRIQLTTNGILIDRYGAAEVVSSGLTTITVSLAGFDRAMYERVYRSNQYPRVRRNLLDLLEANRRAGDLVNIVIALRPDRPLDEVTQQPDFREVQAYRPEFDFTWSFTTAGGRITREMLPPMMRLRARTVKREPCVQTYNGPIVLADGTVMACSCVAAVDAVADLKIGNILTQSIGDLWRSERMRQLRTSFGTECLNKTCADCDMYRDLELYRTREGRVRAQINRERAQGKVVRRGREHGAWSGG